MSDIEQTQEGTAPETGDDVAPAAPSELEVLKARARTLGVQFSNNIKLETLREKVNAKMAEEPGETSDEDEDEAPAGDHVEGQDEVAAVVAAPAVRKSEKQLLREKIQEEQLKLVRIRISCLDPKKKDLPGEIVTIGNDFMGTVSKFVPFGEATDNGYHVPYCIYKLLDDRRFLNIRTKKVNGQEQVSHVMAKEFAIEVLPQLTPAELARLAASQAASGTVDTSIGD
jgi:hypothetical protein